MFPETGDVKKSALLEADRWILEVMNRLIEYTYQSYSNYDFHGPVTKIKHFIWETFASHYLELVKNRVYNKDQKFTAVEQKAAVYTLYLALENILKLLAPIVPFITFRIYQDLKGEDIHFTKFPEPLERFKIPFTTDELENLNSLVWKTKKENGVSLRDEVKELTLPEKFMGIEKDLKHMHNVLKVKYGDTSKVRISKHI
jgi:valyl-tRNA synthetase